VIQTQGKNGWFWYIPLHNNIVSVGVVAAYDYLFTNRETKDLEKIYFEEVARCPALHPRLEGAKRASEFKAAKEYSYRSKEVAGDGWVLVGDAFGFLDPLYSSGVLLALKSGSLAADAICDGLEKNDTSAATLSVWGPGFIEGMERMRRLVCEYYDGFSFGRFVKRHPHLKGHLTDLLIGDLFDDKVDDVIAPMNEMRAEKAAAAAAAE
jgi:flavin-dependent dehydrogenase